MTKVTPDRQTTTDRYEWDVPCHGPWGATHVEFEKTMRTVRHAYRTVKGIDEAVAITDDAIRVRPGDDGVVIYFDIERRTT